MNKQDYVTTDQDMWNAADGTYFFVVKGEVKKLPEDITPIINDAINQRLLREPTDEEMARFNL
jgi:hypothetical protein